MESLLIPTTAPFNSSIRDKLSLKPIASFVHPGVLSFG
jgi:hypothetical protein